jgi:hypothetical protein
MLLCAIIIAVLILFILLYTKYEKFSNTFLDVNPEYRYDDNKSIICNILEEDDCEQYGCRYDGAKKSCIKPDYCDELNPTFKIKKNEDKFKRETGCELPLNMRNYNPECLYYSGNSTKCAAVKPNGSCDYLSSGACVSKNRESRTCLSKTSCNANCETKPIYVMPTGNATKQTQTRNICVNLTRPSLCGDFTQPNCKSKYCYYDTTRNSCLTRKDPDKTYQTLLPTPAPTTTPTSTTR